MFVTRLISGVILLALTAGFLYVGSIPLYLILAVISVIGFLELTKAVGIQRDYKGVNFLELIGISGTVALYVCHIAFDLINQVIVKNAQEKAAMEKQEAKKDPLADGPVVIGRAGR